MHVRPGLHCRQSLRVPERGARQTATSLKSLVSVRHSVRQDSWAIHRFSEPVRRQHRDHDQQRCRYRDDPLGGEMQSPEADVKSIAHARLSIERRRESLGLEGMIDVPTDLAGRQRV